ncbi:MAG: hypothetical protein ACI9JM_001105 [Halioglobus sp.]|jgi:hypothetical protein
MPIRQIISALLGRKKNDAALQLSELDARKVFENLATALPVTLKYEWDDRFGGILAAFESADKDSILSILGTQLGQSWDSASIGGAPASIRNAIKEFGGLTPGQHVFACGLTQEVILLGLWWPWGNGVQISIRFVPYGTGTSNLEDDAVRTALKGAFGL